MPEMIVRGNSTDRTINADLHWWSDCKIKWRYIAPEKPMRNGIDESFNRRMRGDLLK